MNCGQCGAVLENGSLFCPKCGAKAEEKTPTCSSCNAPLAENSAFCNRCGQAVVKDAYCNKCGAQLKPGAEFCSNCGKPIAERYIPKTKPHPSNAYVSGGQTNDLWVWLLATAPLLINILLSKAGMEIVLLSVITIALNALFFYLDKQELEKQGYEIEGWMWLGLVIVPVYLFARARKLQTQYSYAFLWCVIFVLSFVI